MIVSASQFLLTELGAIDQYSELRINMGADFIAQYTTRQEYKYADALPEYDHDWVKLLQMSGYGPLRILC